MRVSTLSVCTFCIILPVLNGHASFTVPGLSVHVSDKWKTLKGSNFSIQYPSDWEVDESGQMGTSFMLFSPLETDQDQFRENVNLLIQDLSEYPMTLDAYTEFSVEQIKALGFRLIENTRVENAAGPYDKLAYSGTEEGLSLIYVQHYWVVGTNAYLLTFTGELDHYENFRETANKILDSCRLNP